MQKLSQLTHFAADTLDPAAAEVDIKFCLLEVLLLWLSDGPVAMRGMGAILYNSGGRSGIKFPVPPPSPWHRSARPLCSHLRRIGGDGSYERPYGTVETSKKQQDYSQDVLSDAYDKYQAELAARLQ